MEAATAQAYGEAFDRAGAVLLEPVMSVSVQTPEEFLGAVLGDLQRRRAVIEAYQHLTQVIYMGFYSLRSLTRANLRYSISEHLYPAHEILVDQIARAHSYEECQHRLGPCAPRWSEQVVLGLFQRLPGLRRALSGDVNAAFTGDPAAASIEEIVFSYPGIRALTAHRIAHVLYEAGVPMIRRPGLTARNWGGPCRSCCRKRR